MLLREEIETWSETKQALVWSHLDCDGKYGLGSAVTAGSLSETKHEFIELSVLRARSRCSMETLYYLFYTAIIVFIPNFFLLTGKIQEFLSEFDHPHHKCFFFGQP